MWWALWNQFKIQKQNIFIIILGHKVALVLEGDADGYIFASAGCKRWDTCAGEAILEAIGGKLTDVFGNLVNYDFEANDYVNRSGVVASLNDHDLYISTIPDSVKEKLKVNK